MLLLDGAANPVHSRTGHYSREISRNMRDNIPVSVEITGVKYRMPRTGHPIGRIERSVLSGTGVFTAGEGARDSGQHLVTLASGSLPRPACSYYNQIASLAEGELPLSPHGLY